MRVESQPNEGTIFEILLPRSGQPPSTDSVLPPAPKSELPRGDGVTVLVVEDDPAVRMGIRHYLEQGGYRVVEASNSSACTVSSTVDQRRPVRVRRQHP